MTSVNLTCHPSTPSDLIHHFEVRIHRNAEKLSLKYAIDGEITSLCIPAPGWCERANGLWRSTCFESFLKGNDQTTAYYEFNFSPSTAWAIYRFGAYREGMQVVAPFGPPKITLRHNAHQLELEAVVNLDDLPVLAASPGLRLALSTVIEEKGGRISYWACAHPPGKPDFHHPDSFAFKLDQPDRA